MKVVASTIVLGIVLAASSEGRVQAVQAGLVPTGPIEIAVVYTQQGNLHYYSLSAANYQSQFSLYYAEYLRRPQPGEARTQFLVFNLPGSAGRQLTAAFLGLEISWNPRDYYWLRMPEYFPELPEDHVPCGMVASGAEQLLACPISAWASARQSAQANNLAWFIQLLEATRYRSKDRSASASREESGAALLHILQRIPSGEEVQVAEPGTGRAHQIPVASNLRGVVAQALVYGDLLEAPMSRPEVEIRQAAAEWYADRLPQEDARRTLLQALSDKDSRVRAAAATALASDITHNDRATIEALRSVLQREPDPLVRQVIQDLLDGANLPPIGEQRNGS